MGRLGLKGCDIMYDISRLQRKRVHYCNNGAEFENSDVVRFKKQIRKTKNVDEDYVQFLMLLYNYDKDSQSYTNGGGNEGFTVPRDRLNHEDDEDEDEGECEDEDENEDEDEDDPEYMKFLANAKPNGKSYVVKIDREDGFPVFIEYEKEDGSDEECELSGQRKQQDDGDAKDLGNVSSKDKVESQPFSRTVLENDNDGSAGDSDVIFEPFDSQKEKRLMNQKLSTGENGAFKRRRKGETKNKSNKKRKTEKGRKPANITTKEEASDVDEDYSLLLEKFISKNWRLKTSFIRKCKVNGKNDASKKKKKKRLTSQKNSMNQNDASKRHGKDEKKKRSSKEKTTRKGRKSANVTVNEEVAGAKSAIVPVKEEVANVDEASFKSGHDFESKAAEEDLEILVNDNGKFGKEGSSSLMQASSTKHYESVEDTCPTETVHSDFWRKVKALLEKPYDQKEYIGLWKAVKSKKFTERNMDLRNGGISYPTRIMGKSYLDHYEDLHERLKEVDADNRKKLYILRGFFFWLQNLTQEGAFRPWTNPEWLSLVAKSS
ncbi:PREDICTED: transcriptional regulator ATRX homolog [Nicotiana attenuata]|uniref:Uncharacterized protein n=1 Tax=Nicotiana attenuata TaxID=49451 RepID=A0A1J6HZH8_NICAT|nr:PREDICTED: transcriptional regulator ATRX homolog [Nicotiana attenuata]XP_019254381.1 PREDICTED: transcriptional regulator ATRX homolog [Nicotiana attenuata]XP_019254382.1 PREDICTED: transcriptional regulator ATRX homolog [Nicotiana attenuata]XP_019254383.1 PREDICTED: transcriptional regulator ATRX homolog [Nicotiana attenuata]OIS97691.1 hypothetical protein A4A49_04022 [Nicotiana attenuata]